MGLKYLRSSKLFLFDIDKIALTILNYPISYLELVGTVSGLFCVYLTAKERVICWPVGIVNIIFFFIMFYQVQLYSDMILQVYFLIMSFYGWWKWTHPIDNKHANRQNELKITDLTGKMIAIGLGTCFVFIIITGTIMKSIHLHLPSIFPKPAAFPYGDAFTTVFSIAATVLMTVKKRQCWLLWISVDIVATVIYFMKGINLVAIEYIIFGIIATGGYINWSREQNSYTQEDGQWEPD